MKIITLFFCILFALNSKATLLTLDSSVTNGNSMSFETHREPYTLALNLPYEPILKLRNEIAELLDLNLKFFTGWHAEGEAHVTIISPPEINILSKHLAMEEIDQIAREHEIQNSDLVLLGLGSGKAKVNDEIHETFFVIVDSSNIRKIRLAIYKAYVEAKGNPSEFDPTWYFPHITVGFTHNDVHEHQGLLKDIKHSWEKRFQVKLPN